MTSLMLVGVTLGLVLARALAQKEAEAFCKHNEYPQGISVGEYGEIHFKCARMECGQVQPKCNQIFFELSCKDNQWVGGVASSSNLNNLVPLQCCDVPSMANARNVGTKVIAPGGQYKGEQLRDNRGFLVAYDVIRNVQKISMGQNKYALEVTAARLSCKGKGPSLESAQLGLGGFGPGAGLGGDGFGPQGFPGDNFGDQGQIGQLEPLEGVPQDAGFEAGQFFGEEGPPIQPQQQFGPVEGPVGPQLGYAAIPAGAGLGPAAAAAAGGLGLGGGGVPCFAADTTVETPSGIKTMEELKVGDYVLTVENGVTKFTPITSFLHRLPEIHTAFHQIQDNEGNSLKLTPLHFLYTVDCDAESSQSPIMKYAQDVKPGECWVKVDNSLQTQNRIPIVSNTVLHQTGAYAPLTKNGVIAADGIMASCYAIFKNDEFMEVFVHYADMVKDAFGGLFNVFGSKSSEGFVDLPWLVKYGYAYLDKFVLSSK